MSKPSKRSMLSGKTSLNEVAQQAMAKLTSAQDRTKRETEHLAKLDLVLEGQKEARAVVTQIAEAVQQKAHSRIASVVSMALSMVFDEPYEFVIRFERKRNRTEAVLEFRRDDFAVDPMTAAGGGVVDVASFALRVACMVLKRNTRPVLILDEPFRFVAEDLRDRVAHMVDELSKKMGVQIIMVTHMKEFQLGKVVEV